MTPDTALFDKFAIWRYFYKNNSFHTFPSSVDQLDALDLDLEFYNSIRSLIRNKFSHINHDGFDYKIDTYFFPILFLFIQSFSLLKTNATLGQQLYLFSWQDTSQHNHILTQNIVANDQNRSIAANSTILLKGKLLIYILIHIIGPKVIGGGPLLIFYNLCSICYKFLFLLFSPSILMGADFVSDLLGLSMKIENGASIQKSSAYEILNRQLLWSTFTETIEYFFAAIEIFTRKGRKEPFCSCHSEIDTSRFAMLGSFNNCGHRACFLCSRIRKRCQVCHASTRAGWTRFQ